MKRSLGTILRERVADAIVNTDANEVINVFVAHLPHLIENVQKTTDMNTTSSETVRTYMNYSIAHMCTCIGLGFARTTCVFIPKKLIQRRLMSSFDFLHCK